MVCTKRGTYLDKYNCLLPVCQARKVWIKVFAAAHFREKLSAVTRDIGTEVACAGPLGDGTQKRKCQV